MAGRLKIAQIITRLDRGGSADIAVELCERLDPKRFDLTLITGPSADPVEPPTTLAQRTGVTVALCDHLVRPVRPARDLRALLDLRTYLARLRPDVVHTHTSKAGALGRIAASLAGRIPLVHSPHGHLFYGYYRPLGSGLVVLAERLLAPLADRLAVLTRTSVTEHLDRAIGQFDQYLVAPSGIDLERFRRDPAARDAIRATLDLPQPPTRARPDQMRHFAPFVIGWVGRFTHVKAPDLFLQACAHLARQGDLPHASFLMAGDGELSDQARAQAKELGIADACRLLGQRADIPDVLNACDAFVLSSRNEGLGLAAVEAMACGVPVIATDVGGASEVLDHGRAGLLVPPNQPAAIAAALLRLARDDELRTRLVIAGLKRAAQFDINRTVETFAAIYEELAAPCPARS